MTRVAAPLPPDALAQRERVASCAHGGGPATAGLGRLLAVAKVNCLPRRATCGSRRHITECWGLRARGFEMWSSQSAR